MPYWTNILAERDKWFQRDIMIDKEKPVPMYFSISSKEFVYLIIILSL